MCCDHTDLPLLRFLWSFKFWQIAVPILWITRCCTILNDDFQRVPLVLIQQVIDGTSARSPYAFTFAFPARRARQSPKDDCAKRKNHEPADCGRVHRARKVKEPPGTARKLLLVQQGCCLPAGLETDSATRAFARAG